MARFEDTVEFLGPVIFHGPVALPSAEISDSDIAPLAEIDSDKTQNRVNLTYEQVTGADVVTATKNLFVTRAAGSIKNLRVRPRLAPTGGDKKFTVDLKRAANGSNVFVSLLTAVLDIDSTRANDTVYDASLVLSPALSAGDLIQVVITASGATGSQGQGVFVALELDEAGA